MKIGYIIGIALVLVGCSPSSPYRAPVKAGTPTDLMLWRSKISESLSAREWALFDRAFQEIKFKVMADREATGSEEVEQAARAKVDGKPLYDVVQLGLQWRLNRLLAEKAEMESHISENARLRTKPGDDDSAQILAEVRRTQATRLEQLNSQIDDAKADLTELEKHVK